MIGLAEDCMTKDAILNYFGQKQCDPNAGDWTCQDYNVQVYQLYLRSGLQNKACVLTSDLPNLNAPRSYAPVIQMSPAGGKVVSGEAWTVQLTGAPPSSPVTIEGGPDGNLVSQIAGNTDLLGRKTLSGKFIDSQIGDWEQIWYVTGQEVGRIAFTVIPNPNIAFTPGRVTPGAGTTMIFGTAVGSPDTPLTAISRTTGQQVPQSVAEVVMMGSPTFTTTGAGSGAATSVVTVPSGSFPPTQSVMQDPANPAYPPGALESAGPPASNIGIALLAAGVIGFLILGGGR